jgi:peptide/nickel transport system permease protein
MRPAIPQPSRAGKGWRYIRRPGTLLVGLAVGIAFIGPFVPGPSSTEFVDQSFGGPTSSHPLGADVLGRDVLARVLDGGWRILLLASASLLLLAAAAIVIGTVAAYLGGWIDTILMRVLDVFMAFPMLVFALMVLSVMGSSWWVLIVTVAIAQLPGSTRVVRSAALGVVDLDYVRNAEAIGTSRLRTIYSEILPNLRTPISVEFGLRFTYSIMVLASLDFIGFGQQPPTPTWGAMVNENRIGLESNPWTVIVPVALIAGLTVGLNTLLESRQSSRLLPFAVPAVAGRDTDPSSAREEA